MTFDIVFYFLLLTFFLQTRFAPFVSHQIVDYLIPFIYLSDVLIVLLLLGSFRSLRLLKSLKTGKQGFQSFSRARHRKLEPAQALRAGLSVFLFSTAISNLSAIHPVSAWYHWFKILEFGLFAFFIAWFVERQKAKTSPPTTHHPPLTIYHLLAIGLVFQCFIAIGEFVLQHSLGLQILGEWRFSVVTPGIAKVILFGKELLRPYATFPHPNVLGGILAIMAPISLHLATTETLKQTETRKTSALQRLQIYYLLIFLLFTITLLLTFSRSAWLAYAVLMAIVLVFWGRRRIGGIGGIGVMLGKRKLLLFLLFAVCCLLFAAPFVYQRIKSLQTTDILSVERRLELNRAAISMFCDHPFFGVGLGNFVPNLEKYLTVSGQGRFLQPVHNVPLLILTETGIAGFLTFSLFLGIILYSFVRSGSTKHKAPNNKQAPNSKSKIQNVLNFENWDLGFIWNLEFGTWNFIPILLWTGILIISLFDHYFWTLQAGQLFFWLTVGLTLLR